MMMTPPHPGPRGPFEDAQEAWLCFPPGSGQALTPGRTHGAAGPGLAMRCRALAVLHAWRPPPLPVLAQHWPYWAFPGPSLRPPGPGFRPPAPGPRGQDLPLSLPGWREGGAETQRPAPPSTAHTAWTPRQTRRLLPPHPGVLPPPPGSGPLSGAGVLRAQGSPFGESLCLEGEGFGGWGGAAQGPYWLMFAAPPAPGPIVCSPEAGGDMGPPGRGLRTRTEERRGSPWPPPPGLTRAEEPRAWCRSVRRAGA